MAKKKSKEEKTSAEHVDSAAVGVEAELMEKSLKIATLQSKLKQYQERKDYLESKNASLTNDLEDAKSNLDDLSSHYTDKIAKKTDQVIHLEQEMSLLQDDLKQSKASYEDSVNKERTSLKAEIESLSDDKTRLEKELEGLIEFRKRRVELEDSLKAIRQIMEDEKETNKANMLDMERKSVQEKDKLKKEMAERIKETKAYMMKLTDDQLETTTMRTIMENEQMSSELAYQSRQTEKLLLKNKKLLDHNNDMRRKMEMFKQIEGEFATRNHMYKKSIQSLITRLKSEEEQADLSHHETEDLHDINTKLSERISELEDANAKKTQNEMLLTHRLETTQRSLDEFKKNFDETAQFLITCLTEAKEQSAASQTRGINFNSNISNAQQSAQESPLIENNGEDVLLLPPSLKGLNTKQRERFLNYLLEKLHVFQYTKKQRLVALGQQTHSILLPPISSSKWLGDSHPSPPSNGSEVLWPGYSPNASKPRDASTSVDTSCQTVEQVVPGFEQLRSKIMTEMRPFGNPAQTQPLTVKSTVNFLKKGGGVTSNSLSRY